MVKKLMIIEDNAEVVRMLQGPLKQSGYDFTVFTHGLQAFREFEAEHPDLILLDLGLPDCDGLELAKQIRSVTETPIMIVTAKGMESDKVAGLKYADDYVVKPFSISELLLRINSISRRVDKWTSLSNFKVGNFSIDVKNQEVRYHQRVISLTRTEFVILTLLAQRPGSILNRWELLKKIRGMETEISLRSIDVHIRNLRQKIEPDPSFPQHILTIYGMGYKFREGSPEVGSDIETKKNGDEAMMPK